MRDLGPFLGPVPLPIHQILQYSTLLTHIKKNPDSVSGGPINVSCQGWFQGWRRQWGLVGLAEYRDTRPTRREWGTAHW